MFLCYSVFTAKKIGSEVFLDKSYLVGRYLSSNGEENLAAKAVFVVLLEKLKKIINDVKRAKYKLIYISELRN